MKKRYDEKEITVGGKRCVVYLVKLRSKLGTLYFVPKISQIMDTGGYKVDGEIGEYVETKLLSGKVIYKAIKTTCPRFTERIGVVA